MMGLFVQVLKSVITFKWMTGILLTFLHYWLPCVVSVITMGI